MARFDSYLWLSNIPYTTSFIHTHTPFFIHSSMNGYLVWFHISSGEHRSLYILFELVFLFSSENYPEVEFLDHMVVLFFKFVEEPLYCSL